MVDRSDGLSAPLNYTHTGQKARAVKHMTRWVLKGGSRVFDHKNSAHTILSAVGHLATIVDTMDGLALEAGDGNSHSLCTSAPYTSCTIDPLNLIKVLGVYTPEHVEVLHNQPDAGTEGCSSVLRRLSFIAPPEGVLSSCGTAHCHQ